MSADEATDLAVYTSIDRVSLTRSLAELGQFREVVWSFALRSFRVRYRQAAFGVAWAVIQPLALLALFATFFRRSDPSGDGRIYVRATLGALIMWQLVGGAVISAASALVDDAALMRKVYFPRECPVLGAVLAALADHIITIALLLAGAFVLGTPLSGWLLFIPALSTITLVVVLGAALPLAAMYVYYRDFRYALPLGVQLWLLATPVAYSAVTETKGAWRSLYAVLNPLVGPVESMRNIVGHGTAPAWELLGLSALPSMALLVVGYRVFKKLERQIADVV
jgi:lipopolysaccharide transport system permease protein